MTIRLSGFCRTSRTLPSIELSPECEALRGEVRGLIAGELAAGLWVPNSDFGSHRSAAFSRRLGARGWIGMTWPKRYGGGERSMLERYVVTEELLAAGPRSARTGSPTARARRCCRAMAPRSSASPFCRELRAARSPRHETALARVVGDQRALPAGSRSR